MYTLNPTDIDKGSVFFDKLNANFAEAANPQSSHTDAECRTRFIAEMNKKAALLGMESTTFYEPAGNQPANYTDLSGYTDIWLTNNRNVMSAMDALRLTIYASGIQHINDAWNIQSFTLNYRNGTTAKTATITSTVLNNSTTPNSLSSLKASYDILGGKTGSLTERTVDSVHWDGAQNIVMVVRSKSSGKVYAVSYLSKNRANTESSNKIKDVKAALDYVDANGSTPSILGNMAIAMLPEHTVSLFNRWNYPLLYSNNPSTVMLPASVSKVMTAILLNDNVLDINQAATVHESDRQPPTGTNFVAGDVLTLRDLLQCMLMESSNTSAQVIARVVGGILLDRDANVME